MANIKEYSSGHMWKQRWGFVVAACGMAIGTGNVWRFPKVIAANGGAVFFIAVMMSVLFWAVPLICMEGVLGKNSRMGCIGSFRALLGKNFVWMGFFMGVCAFIVACYYGVVLGWCIRYLFYSLDGVMKPGVDPYALWRGFMGSPVECLVFYLIAMALCAAVIFIGAQSMVESGNRIMIPSIFGLLIFLAVRACFFSGAVGGLEYMFRFDPADLLNPNIYLEAMTQAVWSTGAGWGLFLTYFIYTRKDEDILLNVCTSCFADTSAAMLAALVVIPTIFALSPNPFYDLEYGGNGVAFIGLTELFARLKGGTLMASAFFLTLCLAAISSEIAMIEMGVRLLQDLGVTRKKALIITISALTVAGCFAATDVRVFNNMDSVWSTGLLLSGVLVSLAAMKMGVGRIWEKYIEPVSSLKARILWNCIVIVPVWFVVVLGAWAYQAFRDGNGRVVYWSVAQWGGLLLVGFILNNWLGEKSVNKLDTGRM